ncbi:kinase-like domain-containing protein [Epithele typhae]|uniref:kinase-like domain-containing protein n=1 Tax=Epithele typhae TaxID=378194 RepID=UPI0020073FF3|nr:kinase-like domain-containing protein [Epithele typhae]KAH9932719.1 kinase-like domain-containing protein [Epithele typhae]
MPFTDSSFAGRFLADGRYELLNRLGSGAEGVVFSAREHSSTSPNPIPRAIKIMYSHSDCDVTSNPQTTEAELQSLAAGHPNVADVYDVFEDAEYTYIVTDLFDAGDLHTYVWNKAVPLAGDVATVKRIFLGILDGVAACHDAGVFHRDLKLANILIDEKLGRVCVADFGLATTEDWSCDYGAGTPCYMCPGRSPSPSPCAGRALTFPTYAEALGSANDEDEETQLPYDTRRNDIWALGIILIELTCGLRPWEEASTRTSDRFRAYAADPAALRTFLPISTALDALLRRILLVRPYTKRAPQQVTLEEIRGAVERMERFWMNEEELADAGPVVQFTWDTARRVVPCVTQQKCWSVEAACPERNPVSTTSGKAAPSAVEAAVLAQHAVAVREREWQSSGSSSAPVSETSECSYGPVAEQVEHSCSAGLKRGSTGTCRPSIWKKFVSVFRFRVA